jgi:hypothetical protein
MLSHPIHHGGMAREFLARRRIRGAELTVAVDQVLGAVGAMGI